jgi:hypothetical protein
MMSIGGTRKMIPNTGGRVRIPIHANMRAQKILRVNRISRQLQTVWREWVNQEQRSVPLVVLLRHLLIVLNVEMRGVMSVSVGVVVRKDGIKIKERVHLEHWREMVCTAAPNAIKILKRERYRAMRWVV